MREFFRSTIGQKAVMAVTGLIMLGYLITHALANLLVFQPVRPGTVPLINQYSATLHGAPLLLWVARLVLIASLILHIWSAYNLSRRDWRARPVKYNKHDYQAATYASRTMRWGGVAIFIFIVLHLLHFTTGSIYPSFVEGDPYDNVRNSFHNPVVAVLYILAMAAVGLHLYHGAWSSFKTLGLTRPGDNPLQHRFSAFVAGFLWLGFTLIPLGIIAGLAR